MDPELLFRYGNDVYLKSLKYESTSATRLPVGAVGGFRLIFGPDSSIDRSSQPGSCKFPHEEDDMRTIEQRPKKVPFSRDDFELVVQKFRLPAATAWVILSPSSHFQQYTLLDGNPASKASLRAMDIALSISFDPRTNVTCALLLGCTAAQKDFIRDQLEAFAGLACHPLLLPVLLTGHQYTVLNTQARNLWNQLLDVETRSGQTSAPRIRFDTGDTSAAAGTFQSWDQSTKEAPKNPLHNYNDITIDILQVIQFSTTWESYTNALLLGIECMKKNLEELETDNNQLAHERTLKEITFHLRHWLDFVEHKSKIMLWDIQFIEKRAQAQMNAIYNYMTQRMATDSKRDSSSMKSIALLTMFFLPGTYMATFFAMPFFDLSSDGTIVRPQFWYYWATSVPLTIVVLFIYFGYLATVEHRRLHRNIRSKQTDIPPV
ncbi:hypothetical protein IFM53868_10837 [Aspergillus udagawae]|uniref:Magnesium transport protein CorA n=1 Tax=Aspergillus udagawae TaxID=91492 RepID=A0ABQ1BF58_9EURO|nr:hypothetical protein IFM53868_10837 [Aspergillus udagawae]